MVTWFKRFLTKCFVVAVILLAFGLAGCGSSSPTVNSGEVVSKNYRPAYTEHWMMPIAHTSCSNSGKSQSCTTFYTYIPMTTKHPDRWTVIYRNCNVVKKDGSIYKNKDGSNKCFDRTKSVDVEFFNSTEVGDAVDFNTKEPHND